VIFVQVFLEAVLKVIGEPQKGFALPRGFLLCFSSAKFLLLIVCGYSILQGFPRHFYKINPVLTFTRASYEKTFLLAVFYRRGIIKNYVIHSILYIIGWFVNG